MKGTALIILFLITGFYTELSSQETRFNVKRAPFSSSLNDEFSPVFYRNGIVYCSNMRDNSPIGYNHNQERLFKIVFVAGNGNSGWHKPVIFSRELTSGFNDGPGTFNREGNIIYFSRNNSIVKGLRNINDTTNKLGIFSAYLENGKWADVEPFIYNDPQSNLTTPSLSPEGRRIFFCSDMPGGYGGFDIYYCDSLNTGWDRPVNLGNIVNTEGDESFPFAAGYGMLFFTSDGHPGFGGKDIFYTREINGQWLEPVHLDSAINSAADDFGLVTDSTLQKGYFSTNRLRNDDIFIFNSAPVGFGQCDSIAENKYCFTFYDEQHRQIDSLHADYVWDFGNGIIRHGVEVSHCFPGPGSYKLFLTIIDELTGDTISKPTYYDVLLEEIRQPVIESFSVGLTDNPIAFEANVSALTDIRVTDYYWNFGDGFRPGPPSIIHYYRRKGDYIVQLGLTGENLSTRQKYKGCVLKKIRVGESVQLIERSDENNTGVKQTERSAVNEQYISLQVVSLLMDDLSERQKTFIRSSLKGLPGSDLGLNNKGVLPGSYPLLVKIAEILKTNPELKADIIVRAVKPSAEVTGMEVSERWASEIAFFMKNNGAPGDISCTGHGTAQSPFSLNTFNNRSVDGIIEIVFMRKQQ